MYSFTFLLSGPTLFSPPEEDNTQSAVSGNLKSAIFTAWLACLAWRAASDLPSVSSPHDEWEKNANICSFAFKWLSVQKTSIPPCRFLVALRWKVRACTNSYANSDKWGSLEAASLLMSCKSVTLTFTNKQFFSPPKHLDGWHSGEVNSVNLASAVNGIEQMLGNVLSYEEVIWWFILCKYQHLK